METKLKLFNDKTIRAQWNADEEEWYFSVVDIVAVLTENDYTTGRKYWNKLKQRLSAEGSELVTSCHQLKMQSSDGKYYKTDALDTAGILRLVQSIPSPKAEPFKVWLAKVGSERLDEIADPEKAITRGTEYYRKKGYTPEWINQRLQTIEVRKKLTDEWRERGINDDLDFAILTNELTKAWSGMNVREYKDFKNLTKENLRDNMTDLELIFNMLAEATTTAVSKEEKPSTFEENKRVAKKSGEATKAARKNIERAIGHSVLSPLNANEADKLTTDETKRLTNKKTDE